MKFNKKVVEIEKASNAFIFHKKHHLMNFNTRSEGVPSEIKPYLTYYERLVEHNFARLCHFCEQSIILGLASGKIGRSADRVGLYQFLTDPNEALCLKPSDFTDLRNKREIPTSADQKVPSQFAGMVWAFVCKDPEFMNIWNNAKYAPYSHAKNKVTGHVDISKISSSLLYANRPD